MRVAGDSMRGASIFPGDIAIVDRAVTARDGHGVLAVVDGEFTIKRLRQRNAEVWLEAENGEYQPIHISEGMQFEVWGVVRHSIRNH